MVRRHRSHGISDASVESPGNTLVILFPRFISISRIPVPEPEILPHLLSLAVGDLQQTSIEAHLMCGICTVN